MPFSKFQYIEELISSSEYNNTYIFFFFKAIVRAIDPFPLEE